MMTMLDGLPFYMPYLLLAAVSFGGMLLIFLWRTSRVAIVKKFQIKILNTQGFYETLFIDGGQSLLSALVFKGFALPSGCGGGGTCCQCIIKVPYHDTSPNQQERTTLTTSEINQGHRLACQIEVASDVNIEIQSQNASIQLVQARVLSNEFISPLIKELVISLPVDANFSFAAGQFVNIKIPPFNQAMNRLIIPEKFSTQWQSYRLDHYRVANIEEIERSFSMACSPKTDNKLMFNIGLALPKNGFGPGHGSSYLFSLKAGDALEFSGPLGEFVSDENSQREMIFVGAGTGLAPLKSHIDHINSSQSQRKMSLWFGTRSQEDIFHRAHFDSLMRRNRHFRWTVALSKPDTQWQGASGYIQRTLFDSYLNQHPRLKDCEFFLCGPSAMINDIKRRLQRQGVADEQIKCDDFLL